MALKYCQCLTQYLAGSGVIVGATSITLTTFTDIYGNVLTMTNFGSKGYLTLEPDTTNEEAATFTGVTANANGTYTLTGISTTLAVSPYTETSGLVRAHAGGTKVVITDNVAFWNTFTNKSNTETITGIWSAPTGGSGAQIATSTDIANAITGFTGLATNAVAGTTKISVAAVSGANPIAVGQNDPQFVNYFAETGAADAYVITPSPSIGAYAVGQRFSFKASATNTTAATLNVNAIGAVAIKKNGTVALVAGDILVGAIIQVEHDGTNFQMTSQLGYTATPTGSIQMYAGSTAPTGYLLCDGTSYLRTDYAPLFTTISTTYGSADGTHFNVPDMRGRSPIGVGTGSGGGTSGTGLPAGGSALTAVARATWKGEETHTLTTTEMPSHTHTYTYINGGGASSSLANGAQGTVTSNSTGSAGSDGAHNTIQPVMGVNFIIKT